MSDIFYNINGSKDKMKKFQIIFPLSYLREIIYGVQNILSQQIIYSDMKSIFASPFNRLFERSRRQIVNVLVLIADLESNVGAACIELLNNENPEWCKNIGYRPQNLPFDDFRNNLYEADILPLDFITPLDYHEEAKILDANLGIDDPVETMNPGYFMQLSLPSNADSADTTAALDEFQEISEYSNCKMEKIQRLELTHQTRMDVQLEELLDNLSDNEDCYKMEKVEYIKPEQTWSDWYSSDNQTFSTAYESEGRSGWDCTDKENSSSGFESGSGWRQEREKEVYDDEEDDGEVEADDSEDDSDDDEDNGSYVSGDGATALPKPIRKELQLLRKLKIPYTYIDVTESSLDQFKAMRSDSSLTRIQANAMVNARRRSINRKAASRCRNQKVRVKSDLTGELRKLQNDLVRCQLDLTRACQNRNEMRDKFRRIREEFLPRLRDSTGSGMGGRRWTVELADNERAGSSGLQLREMVRNGGGARLPLSRA